MLLEKIKKFERKAANYLHYNLKDKWEFIYFEYDLNNPVFSLPEIDDSVVIRLAEKDDADKIETDIVPFLSEEETRDFRKHLACIGETGFQLFIAEKNNKFVHFFEVFEHALSSPLAKTPIDKSKLQARDAYLGFTFTIPEVRGLWIVPHSIKRIFDYLKDSTHVNRALVLVHKDTPGATSFYRRLGFKVIEDAHSSRPLSSKIYDRISAKRP